MVLILSERRDVPTYHVVKWLEKYNITVHVITEKDLINSVQITNENILLKINKEVISLNDVNSYWYRRGMLNLPYVVNQLLLPAEIESDLKQEKSLVEEIIHAYLFNVPSLSSYYSSDLNRVCTLYLAKKNGLQTPNFIVCNQKKDIQPFLNKYIKIVNKPIGNGLYMNKENVQYLNYTSMLVKDDFDSLPPVFAPSLFLEYIEKKYELRVFYLDGKCYTMAIFSQSDVKTQIDFRKYSIEKPNRNEAYLLPKNIEKKIDKLMRSIRLKTGSIDIIVTPNDDFVFLEINPAGQFLNVSHICNYNLEKKIAQYLIKIANGNR